MKKVNNILVEETTGEIKRPKLQYQGNYSFDNSRHEKDSGEILVIPDLSFTIEEIIDKFTRGINLGIQREGEYNEDEFNSVDAVDITDIQEKLELRRIASAKSNPTTIGVNVSEANEVKEKLEKPLESSPDITKP